MYLKQTMFLGYIMCGSILFCAENSIYGVCKVVSYDNNFVLLCVLSQVCAQCPVWLFFCIIIIIIIIIIIGHLPIIWWTAINTRALFHRNILSLDSTQ